MNYPIKRRVAISARRKVGGCIGLLTFALVFSTVQVETLPERPELEIRSSTRHFPRWQRNLNLGVWALSVVLFALAMALVVVGSPAWIPAAFGGVASGVVSLVTLVIDSKGKRVGVREGALEYQDVWRTVRTPLSNVWGAFATTTEDGLYLAIRSRSGAVIGVDQEFADADRQRLAEVLGARLGRFGKRIVEVPRHEFWPLLTEFEKSPEDSPRLSWRALVVGGFGAILALVSIPIVVSLQRGSLQRNPDSVLLLLIPIAVGISLLGVAFESKSARWAFLGMGVSGCTAVLFGACSLLTAQGAPASSATLVYVVVVAAGVAMLWVAGWEPRRLRRLKLEIEEKCDLSRQGG